MALRVEGQHDPRDFAELGDRPPLPEPPPLDGYPNCPPSVAHAKEADHHGEHSPRSPTCAPLERPWPVLHRAARHGLGGEIVAAIEPHTEADPAALLVTLLVRFGAYVGPGPHAFAGGREHPARLNALIVGKTARARKGTSEAETNRVFAAVNSDVGDPQRFGGLGSGEALIEAVSDRSAETVDKRAFVVEPEFARVLRVAARETSILSMVIRQAWDGDVLENKTRSKPLRAENTHICVLGHITAEELRRSMSDTEAANGFANRFLFVCARRPHKLPDGGNLDPAIIRDLGARLGLAITSTVGIQRMHRSADAAQLWREVYDAIDDEADGLFGAVTARAEAQMLRLSVAYALLDGSRVIDTAHLDAARAAWRYCEDSAAYIFGDAVGDPTADRLLTAVRAAGHDGYTRNQARELFARNVSSARLDRAIEDLVDRGLVVIEQHPTGGRPVTVLYAVNANNAER